MNQGPRELMHTVFKRAKFFESLIDDPAEKRDLVDRLDVSRSTVNRAIGELEHGGLVEYDDGYRLTACGHLLFEQYSEYETNAAAVADANGLLRFLPPMAPISVDFLRDADIVTGEAPTPHRPASVLTDVISGADRIRGISRTHAAAKTDDVLYDVIMNGGTVEMVFREEVYEHVQSVYDWVPDHVASGAYRPYVTDDLPYGLAIADHGGDTTACLIVYNDAAIAGVIVNETGPAVDWANDVFDAHRQNARRISAPETE